MAVFKMPSVKIIPLGGLEQIGMNITVFETEDSIIIVDCGLAFPDGGMLGIDLVIPDFSYLKEHESKIKALFITHGHEDHIGAIPYLLKDIKVPVYATRLTMELINHKLEEHGISQGIRQKVVSYGQIINLGDFRVEFIKTNHSIADAAAFAITTPAGTIIHTGDFKIDYTPVYGDAIDLGRFAEIGRKGVLALMCDSTNAERDGFTASERTVGGRLAHLFDNYKDHRIIVATFSSNVDRVQQIINAASKLGKKVVLEGRNMVSTISIARKLGYVHIPEDTLIDIEDMKDYRMEEIVLITTGSQGETMASLSRMSVSTHKKVSIVPNDVIIFSSHPIPGNEKAVSRVMNELTKKGAKIIFEDTHVSGHACREEIKLLYAITKPKYAIPIHGEYHHLVAQKELAYQMGIPKENIFVMRSGSELLLTEESAEITGRVKSGGIMVDGLSVGDVGNIVLRDRVSLSRNGIFIVVITLDGASGELAAGPDIVSRGFVYVRESEALMEEARDIVQESFLNCRLDGIHDWAGIKTAIREDLSSFIWNRMKRSPMILPIIMEV